MGLTTSFLPAARDFPDFPKIDFLMIGINNLVSWYYWLGGPLTKYNSPQKCHGMWLLLCSVVLKFLVFYLPGKRYKMVGTQNSRISNDSEARVLRKPQQLRTRSESLGLRCQTSKTYELARTLPEGHLVV